MVTEVRIAQKYPTIIRKSPKTYERNFEQITLTFKIFVQFREYLLHRIVYLHRKLALFEQHFAFLQVTTVRL